MEVDGPTIEIPDEPEIIWTEVEVPGPPVVKIIEREVTRKKPVFKEKIEVIKQEKVREVEKVVHSCDFREIEVRKHVERPVEKTTISSCEEVVKTHITKHITDVVTVYEYEIEEVVETVPVEIEQVKYDFIWVEQELDTQKESRVFEKIPNKVETKESVK